MDLLTYECPYSGRKRVAGQYGEGIETGPTTKFRSCSVKLSLDVSTDFISFQFPYFMLFIQILGAPSLHHHRFNLNRLAKGMFLLWSSMMITFNVTNILQTLMG